MTAHEVAMSTRADAFDFLSLTVVLALSPSAAFAHGGPPSAMGLVAADAAGPTVVGLNEGLSFKGSKGWSFLCPSIWGDFDLASGKLPLARSADGASTWIVGADGVYLLQDQKITALQRPELARSNMIALANDAEHVYGLRFTDTQNTEVVRLTSEIEAPIWTSSDYWSAITASETGIHVARVAGEKQLELVTIDRQGQEQSRTQAMLALTPFEMQLHANGDRVYVTATDGTIAQVGYVEAGTWQELLQDKPPILGPQASADGTLWLAVAGILARLQPEGVAPAAESRMITCLEQWNDWRYACLGPDLHQLTDGGIGERIFHLEDMHAPEPQLVTPIARDSCEQQWVIYNSDAMRSGLTFMEWPTPDAHAQAGSSAVDGGGAAGAQAGATAVMPIAGSLPMPALSRAEGDGGCTVVALAGGGARSAPVALLGLLGACLLSRSKRTRRK
jgi:hypothetical protein